MLAETCVKIFHFDDELSDVLAFVIPDDDINDDPNFHMWEIEARLEVERLVNRMDRNNLAAILEVCRSMDQGPLVYLD